MIKNEEVMTTTEAVKYLKTTKKTLLRLVQEGRIKGNRLGHDYRFLKSEIDKLLKGETDN